MRFADWLGRLRIFDLYLLERRLLFILFWDESSFRDFSRKGNVCEDEKGFFDQ